MVAAKSSHETHTHTHTHSITHRCDSFVIIRPIGTNAIGFIASLHLYSRCGSILFLTLQGAKDSAVLISEARAVLRFDSLEGEGFLWSHMGCSFLRVVCQF